MLSCLGNNHADKGLQVFKYKHNLQSPNCTIHASNSRALCIWASLISNWLNVWKRNHGKTKGRRKFTLKLPEWSIRWGKTTKPNTKQSKTRGLWTSKCDWLENSFRRAEQEQCFLESHSEGQIFKLHPLCVLQENREVYYILWLVE